MPLVSTDKIKCEEVIKRYFEVRKRYTCSVCEDLYTDAHLTKACGHIFCRACLLENIDDLGCPQCSAPNRPVDIVAIHEDQTIADVFRRREAELVTNMNVELKPMQSSPGVPERPIQSPTPRLPPRASKRTRRSFDIAKVARGEIEPPDPSFSKDFAPYLTFQQQQGVMRQKNAVATSPLGSRCPEFDDTAESENVCNKYRHEKEAAMQMEPFTKQANGGERPCSSSSVESSESSLVVLSQNQGEDALLPTELNQGPNAIITDNNNKHSVSSQNDGTLEQQQLMQQRDEAIALLSPESVSLLPCTTVAPREAQPIYSSSDNSGPLTSDVLVHHPTTPENDGQGSTTVQAMERKNGDFSISSSTTTVQIPSPHLPPMQGGGVGKAIIHELKDLGGEMMTTTCHKQHILLDVGGDDDKCAKIVMPSFGTAPTSEAGEEQKLTVQGDKYYPPNEEEEYNNNSNKEGGMKEGFDVYDKMHAGGNNTVEVEVETEENNIEGIIIDKDEMKIGDGHIAIAAAATITKNDDRNINYGDIGLESVLDDEVLLLSVREGKTDGFSTTEATNLTPLKESANNTCSIISPPMVDYQGYCTTPSQEMVKEPLHMLHTDDESSREAAANDGGRNMEVTSQNSSSEEEVVVIENSSQSDELQLSSSAIEQKQQQVDEKGSTRPNNDAVAVSSGGIDVATDPPILQCSDATVPRNPYVGKSQIVSLSESCKVARAQLYSAAATKTRAAEGEPENTCGINLCNATKESNTPPAAQKGRLAVHFCPERGEDDDDCIENDDPLPETAACSIPDTQQVEACKRRLAYLESPSPIKSTHLSPLGGGGDDASLLSPNDGLECSGLGLVSLGYEKAAVTDIASSLQDGEEPSCHSKKHPSHFCVAFCDLNEEQERVSVGLLRIIRQDRVVLEDNIALGEVDTLIMGDTVEETNFRGVLGSEDRLHHRARKACPAYIEAMALGLWILDFGWMYDVLTGYLLLGSAATSNVLRRYEIVGVLGQNVNLLHCPSESRRARANKKKRLLKGWDVKVMVVDGAKSTTRSHIERLVRLCGANLTSYVTVVAIIQFFGPTLITHYYRRSHLQKGDSICPSLDFNDEDDTDNYDEEDEEDFEQNCVVIVVSDDEESCKVDEVMLSRARHSENIPLGSTTPIEMVEEELLLNQDGHHGKKEQPPPSTSTILSSSTKSITTTLPSFSQRKQLPQGFGYISGGFEVEKLSSNSVTNNTILGEFGEKDESQEAQPDFTRANYTMKLFLDALKDGRYLSKAEHLEMGEQNIGKVIFDLMWDGQVMPRIGEKVLEKVITLRGLPRDIINEFLKEHNILLWHPEIQENLKSWDKVRSWTLDDIAS